MDFTTFQYFDTYQLLFYWLILTLVLLIVFHELPPVDNPVD